MSERPHNTNDDPAPMDGKSPLKADKARPQVSNDRFESPAAVQAMIARFLRRQRRTRLMSLTPDPDQEQSRFVARWKECDGRLRQSAVVLTEGVRGLQLDFDSATPRVHLLRLLDVHVRPGPFRATRFAVPLDPVSQLSDSAPGTPENLRQLAAASHKPSVTDWEVEADIRWRSPDHLRVVITNDADCEELQDTESLNVVLEVRGIWSAADGFEDRSVRVVLTRGRDGQLQSDDVRMIRPSSPSRVVNVTLRPLTVTDVHLLDDDEDLEALSESVQFLAENDVRVCRSFAKPDSGHDLPLVVQIADPDTPAVSRAEDSSSTEAGRDGNRFFLSDTYSDDLVEFILAQNDDKHSMTRDESIRIVDSLVAFLPKAERLVDRYRLIRDSGRSKDMVHDFLLRVMQEAKQRDRSNPERLFRWTLRAVCCDWLRNRTGSRRRNRVREVFTSDVLGQIAAEQPSNAVDGVDLTQRIEAEMGDYATELSAPQQIWWQLTTVEGFTGQELEAAMRPVFPDDHFCTPLPNGELRSLPGVIRTIREKTRLLLLYCVALDRLNLMAQATTSPIVTEVAMNAFCHKYVRGWTWQEVQKDLRITNRERARMMRSFLPLIRTETAILESAYHKELCLKQFEFSEMWLIAGLPDEELCERFDIPEQKLNQGKEYTSAVIAKRMSAHGWRKDIALSALAPVNERI